MATLPFSKNAITMLEIMILYLVEILIGIEVQSDRQFNNLEAIGHLRILNVFRVLAIRHKAELLCQRL